MNADVQLARSHGDKGLKTEMVRIEAICAAFRDEWSSSKHGVGQGMAIPERTLKCISLHMPEKREHTSGSATPYGQPYLRFTVTVTSTVVCVYHRSLIIVTRQTWTEALGLEFHLADTVSSSLLEPRDIRVHRHITPRETTSTRYSSVAIHIAFI